MPDKMFTCLSWTGIAISTILTGTTAISRRYRPSSAFDVDPLTGATAMPGFNELAAMYGSYRVSRSRMTLEATSPDARCFNMVLLPLNADPGASPSTATINSWPMNPYAKFKLVAGTGSPVSVIKHSMATEKIFGSKAVYFDDNFAATVGANPANNWFWAFAFVTNVSAVSNININVNTKIELDIEFFNRTQLQN